MKITIESTTKIVELIIDGKASPARIWQGRTENGIPMHAFITRVAVDKHEDASQFEKELSEQAVPRPEFDVYPLRLIL